jgi:simple sugar transport system substrate-binding protein
MKLGSIDLGDQVVTALKDGSMDFALDQQQWLQGYNPVLILDQYVRYGIAPGSSNVVTGPAFVTKDLLDAYTASIKAGVR